MRNNITISDSGFIFDPTSGDSFSVNKIGLEILKSIRNKESYEDLVSRIILEYDVTDKMFEQYYLDFKQMLKSENLLENEF